MPTGAPTLFNPEPAPAAPGLMTADDPSIAVKFGPPKWGLYDSSMNPVITPDSVIKVDFRKEANIPDFPIENGGFGSYNKVQMPYDARVLMAKGGSDSDRATFLNAVDAAWQSLDTYGVTTPEITYASANVVKYDYQREASNGVTLLLVAIYVREVRIAPDASFTQTSQGAGTQQANKILFPASSGASIPSNAAAANANAPSTANQILVPKAPFAADPIFAGTVQPQYVSPSSTPAYLQRPLT